MMVSEFNYEKVDMTIFIPLFTVVTVEHRRCDVIMGMILRM